MTYIKIISDEKKCFVKGQIKNVPLLVARELCDKGVAEFTDYTPKSIILERSILEPVKLVNKKKMVIKNTSVSAYMATFPDRFNSMLIAVRSLLPQVDYLHLWCNEYPDELLTKLDKSFDDKKLIIHTSEEINPQVDIGCLGKFALCELWKGYAFTVDDDFIYSPDYVSTLIDGIERHKRKAVVSIHGRTVSTPIKSYTKDKENFWQCRHTVDGDHECHIIGTGVMALHTDCLKGKSLVMSDVFTRINMSDILFSIEMQKRKIPMIVIAHTPRLVKWILNKKSIGNSANFNDSLETELVNSINWKLNG